MQYAYVKLIQQLGLEIVHGFLGKGETILGHYGQWGMGQFFRGLLGKGTGVHWVSWGYPQGKVQLRTAQ